MMGHNNLKTVKTLHYCKALKKTKSPLIITDIATNTTKNQKSWKMDLYDKNGNPVRLQCVFGNAKGDAKRSGVTAVLEIMK